MCYVLDCTTIGMGERYFAGSWINALTGVQAIPVPSNVGFVLDPSKVSVRCLYPTDGGTLGRDGDGCGPVQTDPKYGSLPHGEFRKINNYFKKVNFGLNSCWEGIDCETFFDLKPLAALAWHLENETNIAARGGIGHKKKLLAKKGHQPKVERSVSWYRRMYSTIMGHTVCTIAEHRKNGAFLLYEDPTPWRINEWQDAMDLQLQFLNGTALPNGFSISPDGFWNEIVMALPAAKQMQDLVQAVFYVDMPDMPDNQRQEAYQRAQAQAAVFGGKPLMRLQRLPKKENASGAGEDVLACVDRNEGM